MTNEQKFTNAEERVKAFHDYCRSHKNGCEDCQLKQFQDDETCVCFAYWLPLKAEEKPDPCPFCSKEVVVGFSENIHKEKYRQVWCSDGERCGYECVMKKTEEEAIAAHNRVARAVRAAKESEVR